jgi:phosphoribosylformimino-5-aminoimidazole carboxamide ribotide isomerase
LYQGTVKPIVGNSLTKNLPDLKTNFMSDQSSADFPKIYAKDDLKGRHFVL